LNCCKAFDRGGALLTPPRLTRRDAPPRTAWALEQAGLHPLLARLMAARGVRDAQELDSSLQQLLPPTQLKGVDSAAARLQQALDGGERICVVADYDCDGATACAVALRGLAMLGASRACLDYVVPDRTLHGYGLSPAVVDLAHAKQARLLVTVDNGIASREGVAHARSLGLDVLVTDHHLPARVDDAVVLPDTPWIVNPNQPDCPFPSKALAGVGVMFYVLLALRARLRQAGRFDAASQPRLDALLDLVALGTVADVVKLDANNRRLVAQGLQRVRSGRLQPGVAALFTTAGREAQRASAFDFGFALGPRLNAAGRLADMTLGIECLLTDDHARAAELAQQLDAINRERREVEGGMREQAEVQLDRLLQELPTKEQAPAALVFFDEEFHEGVVGIVASRLKDRMHRPTFVFARGRDGLLKGSGRSIEGFHLRDALDLVCKRNPALLRRFGGHAMAAGCTLEAEQLSAFREGFAQVARECLSPAVLEHRLATDGALEPQWFTPEVVRLLDAQVWGQAFEPPLFEGSFEIVSQRIVGEKHLKLSVRRDGLQHDAIWFGHTDALPPSIRLAFRLQLNAWQGHERLQLVIEAAA
jgi:single-stranded-DNA-specific exonuclease